MTLCCALVSSGLPCITASDWHISRYRSQPTGQRVSVCHVYEAVVGQNAPFLFLV